MNILGISAFYHDSAACLVKDGDIIEIDMPKRKINLQLTTYDLQLRKKSWKPREPKITTGWLARYAKFVTSANTGAVLKA